LASCYVRLKIHVRPLKRETKLFRESDGTLIMHVTSPPAKGKANREIITWLRKQLRIASSNVRLVAGFRSDMKVIEIIGMAEDQIYAALKINPASADRFRTT
jgi:uncharacterized protein (TIGR00251 family)